MYSLAHRHLLLNHLPIIVTGLGLLLLAVEAGRHHDELARVALAFRVGALGAFAVWTLWRYRRPAPLPTWAVRVALGGALQGSVAMAWTGLLGGQVRHTQVRSDLVSPAPATAAGAP